MFQILSIFSLIVCITLIVITVQERYSQIRCQRILIMIFVVYLLGNLYCTTFSRVIGSGGEIDLRPFKTYLGLGNKPEEVTTEVKGLFNLFMKDAPLAAGIILNILLYYPLGYLLPILFPKLKSKHVILIGCLCSIATEATQYILKMGWCETDDVIHNTLGTAIGVWVWHLQSKRLNKPKSNELPKD
ncbi:MAG: VanZ family protein [Clostridia bacterium]|nr:VanZ family protein [Clostridia bacterium]